MTFIKQTLKNTASLMLAVWIIGSAYAAISTVSSGDPLTADSWNQIVNKFDGIWENSVKQYVDATVSANSGGGWSNCEAKNSNSYSTVTLTCSAGKSIRSHSTSCSNPSWGSNVQLFDTNCVTTSLTTTEIKWTWGGNSGYYASKYSASIICCDD